MPLTSPARDANGASRRGSGRGRAVLTRGEGNTARSSGALHSKSVRAGRGDSPTSAFWRTTATGDESPAPAASEDAAPIQDPDGFAVPGLSHADLVVALAGHMCYPVIVMFHASLCTPSA